MSDPDARASQGITALPPATTRQLGSGQVLVDSSSVVKELIDNALDARAKSIFVDITANTVDSIRVKDDGHGIPTEDRPLVCRRYCTSKIRDFHDLKEVGGKWLGFRGEALASAASMSKSLSITTRVEGEPIAVKLNYGRDGELISTERDSHPTGTTVKAMHLFEQLPVRKQTVIKSASKSLAKIRRLIQAYALARPGVRFRLHVLKASNNRGDFVYAPSALYNVEDAALKIVGKDCALQCDWTVTEVDDFEIRAFLPKPDADPARISGPGAFISVDARPVTNNRGIFKKIVIMFKDRLRQSDPSMSATKDPFFCLNIVCPVGSYDPNVEPSKDDVVFENDDTLLGAVENLLVTFYPEANARLFETVPPVHAQQGHSRTDGEGEVPTLNFTALSYHDVQSIDNNEQASPDAEQPRWRSSMYGIDEDDLKHVQETQPLVMDEEDDIRSAAVSNPWTIALMNPTTKPKLTVNTGLLPSPTKSSIGSSPQSSSPAPFKTPRRSTRLFEPLTPKSAAKTNALISSQKDELVGDFESANSLQRHNFCHLKDGNSLLSIPSLRNRLDESLSQSSLRGSANLPKSTAPVQLAASHQRKDRGQVPLEQPSRLTHEKPDSTWFGQPIAGSKQLNSPRKQQGKRFRPTSLLSKDIQTRSVVDSQGIVQSAAEGIMFSENNKDIREYFRGNRDDRGQSYPKSLITPSFTPINGILESQNADILIPNPGLEGTQNPTSQDMEAEFLRFTKRDGPSPSKSVSNGVWKGEQNPYLSREIEVHFGSNRSPEQIGRIGRRKTSDRVHRRKSSNAPLEQVPEGSHMQDTVLTIELNTEAVCRGSRKLDIYESDLKNGFRDHPKYDAFTNHTTEAQVMGWVLRLDHSLHGHFEKLPGADTRSILHEGIQRGLDSRKQQKYDDELDCNAVIDADTESLVEVTTPVSQSNILLARKKVGDWMSGCDTSQSVHFTDDEPDYFMSGALLVEEAGDKVDGKDEDDILMDV